jgi:hypothetical protein
MAVHVDELTTDVQAVDDTAPAQQAEERPWDRLAKFLAARARAAEDAARTRAEGFDD